MTDVSSSYELADREEAPTEAARLVIIPLPPEPAAGLPVSGASSQHEGDAMDFIRRPFTTEGQPEDVLAAAKVEATLAVAAALSELAEEIRAGRD